MSNDGSYIVESMTVGWWTQPVGEYTHDEVVQQVAEVAPAYIALAEQAAPYFVSQNLGYMPEIDRIETEQPQVATSFICPTEHKIAVKMKVFYKVRP